MSTIHTIVCDRCERTTDQSSNARFAWQRLRLEPMDGKKSGIEKDLCPGCADIVVAAITK